MPEARPAVRSDAEAIASFTTETFTWGDYVASEFLDWLDDPDQAVAVVPDEKDRAVAVAKVTMLGPREGWLSAIRVQPEHRRKGLGSILNDWCVDWVRDRGGVVARLQIETWNEAAVNQVTRLGYRPVAQVLNAERSVSQSRMEPVTNGGRRSPAGERLEKAPRTESEGAFIAWSTSELARAAHGMFALQRWAWRRLHSDDLRSTATWSSPSGWIVTREDGDELTVHLVVCNPEDAERLVRATVDLAHQSGRETLHLAVPAVSWLENALNIFGFESFPSRLYEKAL